MEREHNRWRHQSHEVSIGHNAVIPVDPLSGIGEYSQRLVRV
jgi:hypothetical protein